MIVVEPTQLEIIDRNKSLEKNWNYDAYLGIIGIGISIVALIISWKSANRNKEDLKKFVKGQRIFQDGVTAMATKNYKNAKIHFDKYLASEIDSSALTNAGNASFYMKKYYDAFELYQEALIIDHNNLHAIHNMGVCLTIFEEYEHADLFFRDVIQMDNSYQSAFSNLGLCLINRDLISKAFLVLNKAANMDGNDPIPHVYKSQAYVSQQNYKKALESVNIALKLDSVNIDALNQKSMVLALSQF